MSDQNIKEVGDHKYLIGRLPAMKQFHVARRLGVVLTAFGEVFKRSNDGLSSFDAVEPLAKAVGMMSDEDSEYVIRECLTVCQRDLGEGKGWARVAGTAGIMYNDIDMMKMLQLVFFVLQENLADFIPASIASAEIPPAATPAA